MRARTVQSLKWLLLMALFISMAVVTGAAATPVHTHISGNADACAAFHAGTASVAPPAAGPVVGLPAPVFTAVVDHGSASPHSEIVADNYGRAPPVL